MSEYLDQPLKVAPMGRELRIDMRSSNAEGHVSTAYSGVMPVETAMQSLVALKAAIDDMMRAENDCGADAGKVVAMRR